MFEGLKKMFLGEDASSKRNKEDESTENKIGGAANEAEANMSAILRGENAPHKTPDVPKTSEPELRNQQAEDKKSNAEALKKARQAIMEVSGEENTDDESKISEARETAEKDMRNNDNIAA